MDLRRLGRTDIRVSSICLGTMTFGEQNTEAEGHTQLDLAADRGVNFLDAAELYPVPPKPDTQGRTEEIVGSWLKARGNRDKMIVATKVVGRTAMTWFRDDGSPGRLDRRQIEEAVEKSLRRLGTDYIDLYQLHWPDREVASFGSNAARFVPLAPAPDETSIEETLAVLADLVTAGKIRHIGLSNETAWGTMRFVSAAERGVGPRVVSIQNAYNLVNRSFEVGLAEVAMREQVGLLAYSPLAQGYLTGKYENGALPAGSRKQLFNRLQRYEKPGAAAAFTTYIKIARDFGLDPALFANAYVTSRPFVTSNIIGATSIAQLEVALASAEVVVTAEMEAAVDAAHQLIGNPCT
ncbi:aldo/keto reductase [Methylobrevis albus]|uniref:Aldo/keto reductase n=1 Tax=Methylobrevis albus TaxID=2793297 RepID=A0A931I0D5_9HYPH|nr:aldo/keto reductase [Methylobrevis albus]MBH0237825.1 aldo/keto reductase [Methylobrevis albus]